MVIREGPPLGPTSPAAAPVRFLWPAALVASVAVTIMIMLLIDISQDRDRNVSLFGREVLPLELSLPAISVVEANGAGTLTLRDRFGSEVFNLPEECDEIDDELQERLERERLRIWPGSPSSLFRFCEAP